ncbi:MAG: hypothetical protein ACK4KV_11185 [Rhodocyclaceae bacterium]
MRFPFRQWTDAEKWAMGLVSVAVIAITSWLLRPTDGDVVATVASGLDNFGRCVDKEILIINETEKDAIDLRLAFDVDHFTRNRFMSIEYGDERDQMVPPGRKTLIPRGDFVPIEIRLDTETSTLVVPRLQPKQRLHLFFGAETVHDTESLAKREKLLLARDPELMTRPRVASITRRDGQVRVTRLAGCNSR